MEQFDLFSTTLSEERVFELLRPTLIEILQNNNAGSDSLDIVHGKSYSSVSFLKYDAFDNRLSKKHLAFRICCRAGHCYFGISNSYVTCIPKDFLVHVTSDGKSDGYTNFAFSPSEDSVLTFSPLLTSVLSSVIDSIPKEFDCCSRYEECSNLKKCVNPNPALALSCGYRKILKSNRIYYGDNRNID